MARPFVPLNRNFAQIPIDQKFDADHHDALYSFGLSSQTKWIEVLEKWRVIILAEAGAGKTKEIEEITKELRRTGKRAFFIRLEHLIGDIEDAFQEGTKAEFSDWINSDDDAWIFLDSVDEARLIGPKSFETAIRKFSAAMRDCLQRAHIFITSRITEWRPVTDLQLVKDQLPYREKVEIKKDELSSGSIGKTKKTKSIRVDEATDENSVPDIYALKPLDIAQIRIFSVANGVTDPDQFISALEESEAAVFAARPLDLVDLVEFWNANRRVGRRKELLDASLKKKLVEIDPDRASALPLTFERALSGAKMLAAASTLLKTSRIQVPDSSGENEGPKCAEVLTDWTAIEQRALLSRAIFDEEIYGSVRFYHRMVREYLTALWLHDLIKDGKSRREIESLFFKNQYGFDVFVSTIRKILSWMIILDEPIRTRATKIAPEIVIEGGDPSALPHDIRTELLEQFCAHYSSTNANHPSFALSDVLRFTHKDMGLVISKLLAQYESHEYIRQLLLRMAWQASIVECVEQSLQFALDQSIDKYTRITAIRLLATAGSEEQKAKLITHFVNVRSDNDDNLLSEIVESFGPTLLRVEQLLALIRHAKPIERDGYSSLEGALETYVKHCLIEHLFELIRGLKVLMDEPPFGVAPYEEVSQTYCWLHKHAAIACERLLDLKHSAALSEEVIAVIALSQSADVYDSRHTKKHKLRDLVCAWPQINYRLFWYDIEYRRQRLDEKKERLTEWWRVAGYYHYWSFGENDFDILITDITGKPLEDDRLVALSLAFRIYIESGRKRSMGEALKRTVRGHPSLELTLKQYFRPSKQSDDQKKWKQRDAGYKKRNQERELREAKRRAEWKDSLEKNVYLLRDTRHSKSGSIWNLQNYLLNFLRELTHNNSKWAQGSWHELEAEFGVEIARAFRDGAVKYWKEYTPPLHSEGVEKPNSVTMGTIFGLLGLEYSAQEPDWLTQLTEEEARFACRYAFRELNGFPSWMQRLHSVFPHEVKASFLTEIQWELESYDGESECHYVLSDVSWQADWLKNDIAHDLLGLLKTFDPKHDASIRHCLAIILACKAIPGEKIAELAQSKLEKADASDRRALWFAAWVAADAAQAIDALTLELELKTDDSTSAYFAISFIHALLDNRRGGLAHGRDNYATVGNLVKLYELMLKYIRRDEDIDRLGKGAFSPTSRDDAQNERDQLFKQLAEIPGKETYIALRRLEATHPDSPWYGAQARERAEKDADFPAWSSEDIKTFSKESERNPREHAALFELVKSRLNDLKFDLEDGDSSIAGILVKANLETDHRKFIGSWLRDRSFGRYSVPQEEELADAKKPDIRVHGYGFDGPVPIELKIADNSNWSGAKLFERLENQLCGDYLRDQKSTSGVYLLLNRGEKQVWEHPITKLRMSFIELVEKLQTHATTFIADKPGIDEIHVIGIDLTIRTNRVARD